MAAKRNTLTLRNPVENVSTTGLTVLQPPAHTVYLRISYESENKQRLFPYTALTDWFV